MANSKNKQGKNTCIDNADCKTLVVHGTKYNTQLTTKYENRKNWKKVNPNHEINLIPGTIKEVFVKEGQLLKKGDAVLILEAMKMANTIFAPFDCKVKDVNVEVDSVIPRGTLMVEYE
jgi:biotin carboxyl carrier protein